MIAELPTSAAIICSVISACSFLAGPSLPSKESTNSSGMTTVAPTQGDLQLALLPPGTDSQFIVVVSRQIRRAAERLPGHYTVGKLDAFEQFQLETPSWMVAAILLLTPMLCLLVNLLLESLPLTDPAVGLRGSAFFQLRHFLTVMVIAMTPIVVKQTCVPQYSVRSWQIPLGYGVSLATVAVATNVVIAQVSGCFPVPFSQFGPIIPMAIFGRLVFDRRLRQVPEVQAQVNKTDQRSTMDLTPILSSPLSS
ncbi:hypothetical protein BBJ28_00004105 [Nothophytophthora sp. Chile5]|nr:hypothetical protein BBJ28_00004105 [Nothophytophthora sp. Chile5]